MSRGRRLSARELARRQKQREANTRQAVPPGLEATASEDSAAQAGQAEYIRQGGTLDFFGPDHPRTRDEWGIMWSLMKRGELARAQREANAGQPMIEVRRVLIEGAPSHFHPGEPEHERDYFVRGRKNLGELGHSLLRSTHWLMANHLFRRQEALRNAYEDLVAGALGAHTDSVPDGDAIYKDRAPLFFWDALGLLHQVSEQLAVLFDARRAWRSQGGDLGERILNSGATAESVIVRSPDFRSDNVWKDVLGLPIPKAAREGLGPERWRALDTVLKDSLAEFMWDVDVLTRVWNEDLFRVSNKYKHAYPILVPDFGSVWLGVAPEERDGNRKFIEDGALVVADTDDRGRKVELVAAVRIGGIENLFLAIECARWLGLALIETLLQRGERESARAFFPHHRTVEKRKLPPALLADLEEAYVGPPGLARGALQNLATTDEATERVEVAARRLRGRVRPGYWNEPRTVAERPPMPAAGAQGEAPK